MKKLFDIAIALDFLADQMADPAVYVTEKAISEDLGLSVKTIYLYVQVLKRDLGAEVEFNRSLGLHFVEPFDFWAAYREYCRNAPV